MVDKLGIEFLFVERIISCIELYVRFVNIFVKLFLFVGIMLFINLYFIYVCILFIV